MASIERMLQFHLRLPSQRITQSHRDMSRLCTVNSTAAIMIEARVTVGQRTRGHIHVTTHIVLRQYLTTIPEANSTTRHRPDTSTSEPGQGKESIQTRKKIMMMIRICSISQSNQGLSSNWISAAFLFPLRDEGCCDLMVNQQS